MAFIICPTLIIAGALLAIWLPFAQMFLGLAAITVAILCLQVYAGVSIGYALVWALVFFACAQFGYAAGLVAIGFFEDRRARQSGRSDARIRHARHQVK